MYASDFIYRLSRKKPRFLAILISRLYVVVNYCLKTRSLNERNCEVNADRMWMEYNINFMYLYSYKILLKKRGFLRLSLGMMGTIIHGYDDTHDGV